MMRTGLLLAASAAVFIAGCAQIEHQQQLVEATGTTLTVPVGGTIATMNKQKDLPNAFGKADIFGRKVDTGFIKIVYKGPAEDGGAIIEQVDLDIRSNASVFTRMPNMYTASSTASVYGHAVATGGVGTGSLTGNSFSSASARTPHAETNIVLPPVTIFQGTAWKAADTRDGADDRVSRRTGASGELSNRRA